MTCVLLCLTGLLNWLINPMAQFQTAFIPPVVQTSRAQKAELAQNPNVKYDGVVLGSSRVLKFEPQYLQQKTGVVFVNLGVNHCRSEDLLAMARLIHDTQPNFPELAIVGVDVAMFSDAQPPDTRLVAHRELRKRIPEFISTLDILSSHTNLISYQQTKASLGSLKRWLSFRNDAPKESFAEDGMIVYHERESEIADGTYDFESALAYNRAEYERLFGSFPRLSPARVGVFKSFVELLRKSKCRCCFFLTTTHPRLETHLRESRDYDARLSDVRNLLGELADDEQIDFMDFTSVASFEGNATNFVDGIHPLESNTRLMINALVGECDARSRGEVAELAIQ